MRVCVELTVQRSGEPLAGSPKVTFPSYSAWWMANVWQGIMCSGYFLLLYGVFKVLAKSWQHPLTESHFPPSNLACFSVAVLFSLSDFPIDLVQSIT